MGKNSDECKKGKEQFEKRFKEQLRKNQNLDIELEWNDKPLEESFAIHINDKRIVLNIENCSLQDFGASGPEEFRVKLLKQKENELINKLKL